MCAVHHHIGILSDVLPTWHCNNHEWRDKDDRDSYIYSSQSCRRDNTRVLLYAYDEPDPCGETRRSDHIVQRGECCCLSFTCIVCWTCWEKSIVVDNLHHNESFLVKHEKVGERLMGQNRLSRWGHRQFDTFRVWRAHIMTFQENFQLTWAKTKSASRYGRPWEESMITHALVIVAYGGINDNARATDDKAKI